MGQKRSTVVAALLLATVCTVSGCARSKYRLEADQEAYCAIAEKNTDPRWHEPEVDIELDPRSRFYDPYSADHPPMPPDDPTAHQYMHCVDGKEGWEHWHDDGDIIELQNPDWYNCLPEYVEMTADGKVLLTIDSALRLAYLHSPSHQSQLETLYLSALDVTTERFRLDTQFAGGLDAVFTQQGQLRPGGESSVLSVGRGAGATPFPGGFLFGGGGNVLQANKRLATAGQILVGFANSFVWEFTQGDVNFASSILSASFIQPLLRGAGRDIALEQLTIVERALLANVRAYHQYRQGFFTQVAIGELGVAGPQRRGGFFGGTGLTGFTGQGAGGFGGVGFGTFGSGGGGSGGGPTGTGTGFAGGGAGTVGGFIGLLQQLQQIRNTEESLSLQLRTLALLEAHLDAGVIDLIQVDQFRQSIETERATLLQNRNGLQFALESYITGILGLPADLPVQLDDTLVRQFQFVAPEASVVQDRISTLQDQVGELPDDASVAQIQSVVQESLQLANAVQDQLQSVQADLLVMDSAIPDRELRMEDVERRLLQQDRKQLSEGLASLQAEFQDIQDRTAALQSDLTNETRLQILRSLVVWLGDLYRVAQGAILVQARARLEAVTIQPVNLHPDDAVAIALQNRLDYMNRRAALVDSWRLIAFNADALQANVSVALGGDLRTTGSNPLNFDGRNSTARAGIQIDAPFQRLLERNNYRQSLIDYQRSRRGYIQAEDGLKLGLRALLRQIDQLSQNLEIQRRAVAISIRRVDLTRAQLSSPVPPPLPGQPPAQFGPTAATSLLTALSDLRNTQNNFMSVWLNYYAARMTLARELGIMQLDETGRWIDLPIPSSVPDAGDRKESDTLPPPIPQEWVDLADRLPADSDQSATATARS